MAFLDVGPSPGLYPQIQLQWAPASGPLVAAPTFVDLTSRVRGFEWTYGRDDELARFEAGNGSVILDNRDRALDPLYTPGAWFGNIKPRRQFQMQAKFGGVTYPVFRALSRGYPQSWAAGGFDNYVKVDLVDAFWMLQSVDLVTGFSRPAELTSTRVAAVLDAIGVPAGSRTIDAGSVVMDALTVTDAGTSGLDHVRDCADAEFGQYFIDRDGTHTFHNRKRRLNAASVYTLTDDPGGLLRYQASEVDVAFDDNYLWNTVRVEDANGDASTLVGLSTNAGSVTDYGTMSKVLQPGMANPEDRQALAEYQQQQYGQPAMRAPQLPVQGVLNPAVWWPAALGLTVSQRVTVNRFATSAQPLTLTQNIEGIAHTVNVGGPWATGIRTSPADTTTYWTLDDVTLGVLDSTNLIAP